MSSSKKNALACAAKALGTLKDKQVEVVSNFLEGHDAYGVLPLATGKAFVLLVSHLF